jgi:HAD superfamily hydrolase (TIGR01509 family)
MQDALIRAVFFDARDTLGEVDRPGHLVPYRPSTEKLLVAMKGLGHRLGVITNLPAELTTEQGKQMITGAVLSESPRLTIGDFIAAENIITNHEAGCNKPDPRIYAFAAGKLDLPPAQCLFLGENLIEVLGARAAGMQAELKPCPPGREFQPAPLGGTPSPTDSGRAFEAFFEHEHLLGERIFACGDRIVAWLARLQNAPLPPTLRAAMGFFVYLLDNFADQVHLRAEEAVIPLAVARGMDPNAATWVMNQHDQARAYFRALDVAWRRIQGSDRADSWQALGEFGKITETFVSLFKAHAIRENDTMYPEIGRWLSEADDALVLNIISHYGPPDITPYVALVGEMERALGIETAS